MEKSVLVTIGHPASDVPILPFMKVPVDGSVQKAAKKLRKSVAENPHGYAVYFLCGVSVKTLNPSELYWAAYNDTTDEKPFMASDNFFCKEAIAKELREKADKELQAKREARTAKMLSLEIQEGKCPNCSCYSLNDGHCMACEADICPECFEVLDDCMQCGNCGYGLDF